MRELSCLLLLADKQQIIWAASPRGGGDTFGKWITSHFLRILYDLPNWEMCVLRH